MGFSQEQAKKISFEEYCNQHALSYLIIPPAKQTSVKFSGELKIKDTGKAPLLKDYKLKLLENTPQYFRLKNSDKTLVVKSLFMLRTNYDNYFKNE